MQNIAVVGCGGVAFHAASGLQALVAREAARLLVWDPDVVEEGNLGRQWPTALGEKKARAFASLFPHAKRQVVYCEKFRPVPVEGPMLSIFAWPDNMAARLEVAAWADQVGETGVRVLLVTAGGDELGAQAQALVWNKGKKLADWRRPDVFKRAENAEAGTHACGEQTALCNMAAAMMSLHLYQYLVESDIWLQPEGKRDYPVVEVYWNYRSRKGPRVYSVNLEVPNGQ